jgi:hypothetical protein
MAPLFTDIPIAEWLSKHTREMVEAIEKKGPSGPAWDLQHLDDTAVAEEFAAKFRVEPPRIADELRTEPGSGNSDVFRFALRIIGDPSLLGCSSPDSRERFEGTVRDDSLIFEHAFPELDAKAARAWIAEQVAEVDKRLAVFAPAIDAYNAGLQAVALSKVQEVRAKVARRSAFLKDLNTRLPDEPKSD